MKESSGLRIIKIVAVVQFLGGAACFAGGVRLYFLRDKLISDGILTGSQISKLTIYIWASCLISFLLAYGAYNLREWSRKLLLAFIIFGWLNSLVHLSPDISSFVTPYLPGHMPVEVFKMALLAVADGFLVFFFTRPKIKKLYV